MEGTDATTQTALEQVRVPLPTGERDARGEKTVLCPAKLLSEELGPRLPHRRLEGRPVVLVTREEAEQIEDGDLIVPPGPLSEFEEPQVFEAEDGRRVRVYRVVGRAEPLGIRADIRRDHDPPMGVYVPLRVGPPGKAPPAPAPPDRTERPLIHPEVRRQMEWDHNREQLRRWQAVGERLTERELAAELARLELEVVWDRLDDGEREKTVKAVQEDREWPTVFDRMEQEARQSRREAEEAEQARTEELRRALERKREALQALIKAHEAKAEAERAEAERAEQKRVEERERQREQLLEERDRLVAGNGDVAARDES